MARDSTHSSIFSSFNSGNILRFYSVIRCYFSLFARVSTYCFNLFCRKTAVVMLLSVFESALALCIKAVLQLRIWCQVPRIYATRIVARMHKIKTFWNFSNEQLISITMGVNIFSVECNHPITSGSLACRPKPTRISLLDAIHKCFIRTDWRKVIKLSCIPNSIVAIPAQSSTVMWFTTLHTWWLDSLVSHKSSCVRDYNINKEYCNG